MEAGSAKPDAAAVETLFNAALALAPSERAGYLAGACGDEVHLRQRVEALLRAHEAPEGFLPGQPADAPADGVAGTTAREFSVTEQLGSKISHYKLLQKLGEGGCGVVYMAEQEEPVRRKVALKVIKLGMDTRQVVTRFEAERQALALMDHPNIAKVLDAGATDTGRPYFVMELVGGIKITDFCDQHNLTTRQRLDLFVQVCRAIQHAHQKGVIHRDIKPSNVLVTTHDGTAIPKVIDFGIAKAAQGRLTDQTLFTAFEQFLGTPAYMSPEQAELGGLDIDTRSDIYSLGVLLYELLTGRTPFDSKRLIHAGLDEIRRIIREEEPPRPSMRISTLDAKEQTTAAQCRQVEPPKLINSVRGDLDWIVMKCLEKDRARRYETANGLAHDIERHLSNEPVVASPPGTAYKVQKFVRRNKAMVLAAAVVVAVLVLGVLMSSWQALRAKNAERSATREADKSQQVARFLKDMLEGVGPSKALGRDTTMLREILDKTAQRVGKELTNQPRVEIELRDVLARTYHDLGLYKQAEEMARENLRLARSHFGEEDLDVAQAFKILGRAQIYLGNYAEGEQSTRSALAIYRKVSGSEDPDVATCLDNIAAALLSQSRLAEAEGMQRQALTIRRKLLGDEHVQVAVSLANLAFTLQSEGKLAEAETLSRQGLDLLRKVEGSENPDVATALNNLGLLLSKEGKYAEEEAVHREALAMRRKLLGNDHPDVAQSLHNLAGSLGEQARPMQAEPLIREALEIQRKRLGAEHPDVAYSLNALGTMLYMEGKLTEAEATLREALDMRRRLLGSEHQSVAASLNNLGNVLRDQGKLVEAEVTYREALAMTRKVLGEQHPSVATELANLAMVLQRQGKLAEAEAMALEALALCRKVLGNDHPETVKTVNDLISVLVLEGKLEEAQTLGREQLAGMRGRLPADDPALAGALYRLAAPLLKAGKLSEAEPLLRECLAIREKKLPDDWRTFNTQAALGDDLLQQAKYADAEPLLLSGYEGMKQREARIRGPDRLLLKKALQNLPKLYEATSRADQASEWKKRLQEFERASTNNPTAGLAPKKSEP